ncbi:DUF4367 domain-containing protein [Anaeromassilibacillus senegalensis]|uniref:DUF4367 domain-containing protein n=1 Tax=Anaeromassilibacillus senegalensis TaxID=1673717 RepID=UPI00068312E0|nr:DUF4367 domain-containing protein [Anaeromassilibacillus senegalensis]
MDFTEEQWGNIINRIVEVNSAALMMGAEDIKYPHLKKEQQAFDMALHRYDQSYKPHIIAARVGKRVAIALIAALLAAAMTIMTVSAAREWFIDLIGGIWPGEHVTAGMLPEDELPKFAVYSPAYMPDGYELAERDVNDLHRLAHQTYYRGGDEKLEIKISHYQRGNLKYDHSGDEVGYVYINGDKSTYSRKGERQMLGWSDGLNFYRVTCYDPDVSKDDLIKIAESLAPEPVGEQ